MTTLIDISLYKAKLAYPPELQEFCTTNGVTLPGIDTFAGQAYALMAQPTVRAQKHLGRNETALWEALELPQTDASLRDLFMGLCATQEAGRKAYTRSLAALLQRGLIERCADGSFKRKGAV